MEPTELARLVAVIFIVVGLGSILIIVGAVLHVRRTRKQQPAAARSSQPAPAAPPPSRPVPQLLTDEAEAMSAEERQILTAVNTLRSLPSELQRVLWAASIPHTFDLPLLMALRPDLHSRMAELFVSVQHVWFVEVTPDGRYLLQTPIRRAMIKHLAKPADYDEFFQLSALTVKY